MGDLLLMTPSLLAEQDSSALYLVIAVVAAILGGIGAYYLARFMKGRLVLILPRTTAASSQSLSGSVQFRAKRRIYGHLKVSLVGREKRRQSTSDGSKTTKVEVYRQDIVLEDTRDFESGFSREYRFELIAPTSAQARRGSQISDALERMAEEITGAGGVLGGVLNTITQLSEANMGRRGRLYWHVEAHLDADGVDLFAKKKCTVNLKD